MKNGLTLLFVGWLLGILSPAIVDAIRRRRENEKVKVALAAELREVSYKLALGVHLINLHFGTVNRSHLQWFKDATQDYRGPLLVESSLAATEIQLGLSDEQLAQYAWAQAAPPHQNINLQKAMVPLLDARIASLWYLQNNVQVQLLTVRSHLTLLNELVDQSRYYANLTFGKLEGGNYELVVGNLKDSQRQFALRAKQAVDAIAKLGKLL